MTKEEIINKLEEVNNSIIKLEKKISRQEEDDNYDDNLYKTLEELENKRIELSNELDNIE